MRFGGTATDYQLLETESAEGHPHLRLVVSPSVGRSTGLRPEPRSSRPSGRGVGSSAWCSDGGPSVS